MQRMTQDEMEQEFGTTGVENPMVVDLIGLSTDESAVELTMIERRPWSDEQKQFTQIEEKINRYMGYVLDGFMAEHHPKYIGKKVLIRLRCAHVPAGQSARFLDAARQACESHGLGFLVDVVAPAGD